MLVSSGEKRRKGANLNMWRVDQVLNHLLRMLRSVVLTFYAYCTCCVALKAVLSTPAAVVTPQCQHPSPRLV